MSCNFIRKNGKLVEVRADNGSPSLLYKEAKEIFGEKVAEDIYITSKSDEFQDLFKASVEIERKRKNNRYEESNTEYRDRRRWNESRGNQTLEGAPINTKRKGVTGADPELTFWAEEYARRNNISYNRQSVYVEVDESRAKRIAEEYDKMKHEPQDKVVKEAFDNLIQQTLAQYRILEEAGYEFYFFDETNDPYNGNPMSAMEELRNEKRMGSFATEAGFGSGATELNIDDNPMLADTGLQWGYGSTNGTKKRVLANDLFRCFTPETLVRTSEGFKEIQNIKVGDLVLTHEGRFKKVYETIKNQHKGKILNISTNASYNPIRATLEHPFYVLKGSHGEQKNSICTPYICDRKQPNGNVTPQEKYHSFDWVEAKDLKEKMWFPLTVDTQIKDIDFIEIPNKYYKGRTSIPQKIELTEDFLSFVGLYIAEGSGGTNRININLHKDEQYLIDLVDRFAKSIGYNVKSRVIGNGIVLQINCKILKEWFSDWLGRGSTNKKIPNEFLQLPVEKLKHIAYGIFSGDGKKKKNNIEQTSLTLALQLMEVGVRLGLQPTTNSINYSKNNNHSNTYTTHEFLKSEHNFKQKKYTWRILDKDCRNITKIEEEYYEGFVYNIEVEDDHSYVVENVPVHNCVHDAFGHGLEGAGFRARGEENAWQAHARLFTGSALGAITSETRGQNSWLNYGKFGEQNKTAKVEDTIFADQKTGLMPEWTWKEGFDKGVKKTKNSIEVEGAKLYYKERVSPITNKATGELELELVESSIKGKGNAKKAITKFLEYSDSLGKSTYLAVSPRDKTTTESGLIKLYESFGYKLDSSGFEMTRKSKALKSKLEDKNGEPILSEVTKYLSNQNKTKEVLSTDQKADVLNMMASRGIKTFAIFKDKMSKAFYDKNGMFEINVDKLIKSGLYTKSEAILLEKKYETVRNSVESLLNTDIELSTTTLDNTEIDYELNSFGAFIRKEVEEQEDGNAEVLDENLEIVENNNTLNKLLVASKVLENEALITRIKNFLKVSPKNLKLNLETTSEALNDIADAFIPLGIDVQGLDELAMDEDLKPFMKILEKVADSPSMERVQALAQAYNEKFGVTTESKKVKTLEDKKYYVVDDSVKTEQEIFEEKGLIKHADKLYYKVMRESNESILTKLGLENQIKSLEAEAMTQEGFTDVDLALEVLLYKKAFNSPTKVQSPVKISLNNFKGDFNYLTTLYVADFHIEMIKERDKNSSKWKNFYSLFDINSKGIYLKNESDYNKSMVALYADENLRQYSLISKQMPNLTVELEEENFIQNERDNAVNNSNKLPLYKGNSYKVDSNNIILKGATSKFIKTQDGVMEAVQSKGDLTLYSKLDTSKTEYFQVGLEQPTPNIRLEDFKDLNSKIENLAKITNVKPKSEKDEIKTNKFDCL